MGCRFIKACCLVVGIFLYSVSTHSFPLSRQTGSRHISNRKSAHKRSVIKIANGEDNINTQPSTHKIVTRNTAKDTSATYLNHFPSTTYSIQDQQESPVSFKHGNSIVSTHSTMGSPSLVVTSNVNRNGYRPLNTGPNGTPKRSLHTVTMSNVLYKDSFTSENMGIKVDHDTARRIQSWKDTSDALMKAWRYIGSETAAVGRTQHSQDVMTTTSPSTLPVEYQIKATRDLGSQQENFIRTPKMREIEYHTPNVIRSRILVERPVTEPPISSATTLHSNTVTKTNYKFKKLKESVYQKPDVVHTRTLLPESWTTTEHDTLKALIEQNSTAALSPNDKYRKGYKIPTTTLGNIKYVTVNARASLPDSYITKSKTGFNSPTGYDDIDPSTSTVSPKTPFSYVYTNNDRAFSSQATHVPDIEQETVTNETIDQVPTSTYSISLETMNKLFKRETTTIWPEINITDASPSSITVSADGSNGNATTTTRLPTYTGYEIPYIFLDEVALKKQTPKRKPTKMKVYDITDPVSEAYVKHEVHTNTISSIKPRKITKMKVYDPIFRQHHTKSPKKTKKKEIMASLEMKKKAKSEKIIRESNLKVRNPVTEDTKRVKPPALRIQKYNTSQKGNSTTLIEKLKINKNVNEYFSEASKTENINSPNIEWLTQTHTREENTSSNQADNNLNQSEDMSVTTNDTGDLELNNDRKSECKNSTETQDIMRAINVIKSLLDKIQSNPVVKSQPRPKRRKYILIPLGNMSVKEIKDTLRAYTANHDQLSENSLTTDVRNIPPKVID